MAKWEHEVQALLKTKSVDYPVGLGFNLLEAKNFVQRSLSPINNAMDANFRTIERVFCGLGGGLSGIVITAPFIYVARPQIDMTVILLECAVLGITAKAAIDASEKIKILEDSVSD